MSIFSNVIGYELYHSSSTDLYSCFRMDFASNAVGTEAPNFVYLGLLAINAMDEFNIFSTPATRIRRPTDGPHWYTPDHVFETDFQNWRENHDFGRQNISMSRPPLYSTPTGTNMTNRTTSPIDLITIEKQTPEPTPQTRPT